MLVGFPVIVMQVGRYHIIEHLIQLVGLELNFVISPSDLNPCGYVERLFAYLVLKQQRMTRVIN